MRYHRRAATWCGVVLALLATASRGDGVVAYTDAELGFVASHGPWPPPLAADPGNRFSGDSRAIAIGARLFFDPRLGRTQSMSCDTCHRPGRAFQDGLRVGVGRRPLDRNTPALLNLAYTRWYGWDGAADSLWAQSIRPILAEAEMNGDAGRVRDVLEQDPGYREALGELLDEPGAALEDHAVLAIAGKLLAAYQETLVTPRTPFDEFRDALLDGDRNRASRYPAAAQRGLKLFTGEGRCSLCHFGPAFTNGEFANIGIPHRTADGGVDRGRLAGMRSLENNIFNLAGPFNDDPTGANAIGTRRLKFRHSAFGEFRVPGLRGVAATAPYMHNGSLSTLEDVVRHYSELDMNRLHVHGEQILRPLALDPGQARDLVAFLESLGGGEVIDVLQSRQGIEQQEADGHGQQ